MLGDTSLRPQPLLSLGAQHRKITHEPSSRTNTKHHHALETGFFPRPESRHLLVLWH